MVGFLARFFGPRTAPEPEILPPRLVRGAFFDVVGESHYQRALEKICGGKKFYSAERQCRAILLPEPSNSADHNAVQVIIERHLVGYLAREHALEYHEHLGPRPSHCEAKIVGGWKNYENEGNFGVKLKIKWPPRFAKD